MSQYVKANDGKIFRVSEENAITRESLVNNVEKAKELLQTAMDELSNFDAISDHVTAEVEVPTMEKVDEVPTQDTPEPAVVAVGLPTPPTPPAEKTTAETPAETVIAPINLVIQ